jgi:hypothetical protein
MTFAELKWASFRIVNYLIVVINILTFGYFLYVIAPYTSYFFFGDLRFWKYLSYFRKYYFYSRSYLKSVVVDAGARKLFHLPLTAPPMFAPDHRKFRIVETWNYPVDSCGGCSNCCNFITECCFYDSSQHQCLCYGTLFWRFFNCGRYPYSHEQLVYFSCPKFELIKDVDCR